MATVLLVEDDPGHAQLVTTMLRGAGHRVLTAANGTGGLACARAWHPDVVLLDVSLAGAMTGFDVCRALRAEPDTAKTPIIMLSAWAFDTDLEAGWAAGCDDYLAKPFAAGQLLAVLDQQLNPSHSPEQG